MSKKVRLDQLLAEKFPEIDSRNRAESIIRLGKVLVDEKRIDKPGARVAPEAEIRILSDLHDYVSRGGLKMAHALDAFKINVKKKLRLT